MTKRKSSNFQRDRNNGIETYGIVCIGNRMKVSAFRDLGARGMF